MGVWIVLVVLMLLLFGIDYVSNRTKTKIDPITVFIVLLLSLLSGLRGEMGVDYENYKYIFLQIPSLSDYLFSGVYFNPVRYVEPIYSITISFFKTFSDSYGLFLFVQSLLLLVLVVVALRRLKAPVNIGLILYFFFSYLDHFGQQRMAVVYVLCLVATTYIVRDELFKFIAIIVVASLIQKTAIFFLPAYWFRYALLSKGAIWSFRYDRFNPTYFREHFFLKWFDKFRNGKKFLSQIRFWHLAGIGIVAFLIAASVNIGKLLFENIQFFVGDNPVIKVYTSNFISYFERMERSVNIFNGIGGVIKYTSILIFLYFFKKRWLDIKTAPIFINFAVGIMFFMLFYSIPKLAPRVIQMYYLPAYIFLFGTMLSQKKKPYNITPFIFLYSMFEFIATIQGETGAYTLSLF